jgi:hypothetical protein
MLAGDAERWANLASLRVFNKPLAATLSDFDKAGAPMDEATLASLIALGREIEAADAPPAQRSRATRFQKIIGRGAEAIGVSVGEMIGRGAGAVGVFVGETMAHIKEWWWAVIVLFFLSPLIRPGEPPLLVVASAFLGVSVVWIILGVIYVVLMMLDLTDVGPRI